MVFGHTDFDITFEVHLKSIEKNTLGGLGTLCSFQKYELKVTLLILSLKIATL